MVCTWSNFHFFIYYHSSACIFVSPMFVKALLKPLPERKTNDYNIKHKIVLVCLFVLRFYGPVNPTGSYQVQSVYLTTLLLPLRPASVAQLDAPSDWRPGGRGFNPRRGLQHSFVEIDHEIFSTVILSLPLIQEGQLSVSGKRMCTVLVNRLED